MSALRTALRYLPAAILFALIVVVWQLLAVSNPAEFPRPASVLSAIGTSPGLFLRDAGWTLQEALVGLVLGFAAAMIAAIAMSQSRLLDRALMPVAVVLNVTPLVAVAPVLTALLGIGFRPKYVLTAIVVFFPFLINASVGLRSVDPEALNVVQTLNASRLETLIRLRLPSSLPYLFAAARVCFPLSVVGAVVAEFVAGSTTGGLGVEILQAAQTNSLQSEYAAIILLAAMGIALTAVVLIAQHFMLRWHSSGSGRD